MKVIIYHGEHGRCMIYGELEDIPSGGPIPLPGEHVRLKNARMILRVETVGNLGIAGIGPKPGSETRITSVVPQTACTVHSSAECTKEAAEAIEAWPVWQ